MMIVRDQAVKGKEHRISNQKINLLNEESQSSQIKLLEKLNENKVRSGPKTKGYTEQNQT